jgi:chromosomal replication initiator protein
MVQWVVDAESLEGTEGPATRQAAPMAVAQSPVVQPKQQVNLLGEPVAPPKPKVKRADPDEVALTKPMTSQRTGRRWKALADFVTGQCNRVAHASAISVVEEPGQGANPLVIHGPTGTGKTHLLEGIFAGLKKQSDQRPCYVTAEEFTTRFVQASRMGKMSAFRRQFRECSALILDDLHFLATKKATQEEFLHTFDALVSDGRQVVVTTDCHPRLADELMPELLDRLLGGAVWGLQPPDPDTRLEILRKKSCAASAAIPDSVLKALASSLRGNVRELEGAVNSVRHYAKVTGRPADMQTAREALGDLLRHAVRVVTVADVDAAVCGTLRLANGTLQSKSRAWTVTHPRMVAIYLCRKHTAATYGEIAKHFGAKTHSTAVAAEKKVRGLIEKGASVAIGDRNWPVKELVDRVERELQR